MKIAFVFNKKTDDSLEQAEFDTPETIQAIHNALASGGHTVIDIEMTVQSSVSSWITDLKAAKPDIIFNTAEGYYGIGRESLGPTIFEQLKLPYVGSGPYGCFLTLDKFLTKQMVASRKVPVAEGYIVNSIEELQSVAREMVYPAFVKPNYEGSSKGITERSYCRDAEELLSYGIESLKLFPQGMLIERFIPGRDVTVPYIAGLGDGGVLEALEYVFVEGERNQKSQEANIYDYDCKNHKDDAVSIRCPAQVDPSVRTQLNELMKKIIPALGIVDFARADFRITPDNEIYFLEINALPSLQPGAGIFEASKLVGLDYNKTILKILDAALSRQRLNGKASHSPKRLRTLTPNVGLVYNLKRKEPGDPDYEKEAEFDSPRTVQAITNAIQGFGLNVIPVEATKSMAEKLREHRIDVVFNIAEGSNKRAREAQVPAVCDLLGIEHTASDATCMAITLDKAITKRLLNQTGILTPLHRLYQGGKSVEPGLKFPVIVKPNHEGTSKGIYEKSVVNSQEELNAAAQEQWKRFNSPILCEEYIEGREFTIGLLGNSTLKILGPMEIAFSPAAGKFPVYGFEAKQVDPFNNPIFSQKCPVSLGREMDRKIVTFAKKAFKELGCRDVARIDFKIDAGGNIYFIEINPLPGLSPGFSDLVVIAEKSGMTYENLIKRILAPAVQRWRQMTRGL